LRNVDAVVDFTTPAASLALAELAAQARIVHVIGTTGFTAEDEGRIRAAARHARIVKSGNMSLGVNLLAALVRQAAEALGEEFDIEILEMHHRHKVDAPSGTALLLGEAAAAAAASTWQGARSAHATATPGRGRRRYRLCHLARRQRRRRPFGDLCRPDERLELCHKAQSRDIFARGALTAAQWAFDKKPGLYGMADVLGLGAA
jgi:4-hydroxy-tetrahydrodipicolinate reductase